MDYIDFFKQGTIKKYKIGSTVDYSDPANRKYFKASTLPGTLTGNQPLKYSDYFIDPAIEEQPTEVKAAINTDYSGFTVTDPITGQKTLTAETPIKIVTARNTNVTTDQLMALVPLFKKNGIPIIVTSSTRSEAKTSNGSTSWHDKGQALDIVPANGDFDGLRTLLQTNPEIRQAMANIGVGYIDETTEEMLAKTGGTGKHFHVGPDNLAIKTFNA